MGTHEEDGGLICPKCDVTFDSHEMLSPGCNGIPDDEVDAMPTPIVDAAIVARLAEIEAEVGFEPKRHRYTVRGIPWPSVTTLTNLVYKFNLEKWKIDQERELCKRVAEVLWGHANDPQGAGFSGDFASWFEAALGEEKAHETISREAKDIGKQVHALIEGWLKRKLGVPYEPPAEIIIGDQARSLFGAWLHWAEDAALEPIGVEVRLYSPRHRYVGTADLLARSEGKNTVFDWKSKGVAGGPVYPEQTWQSLAYRSAAEELGLGSWEGRLVRLPKDGSKVEVVPVPFNQGKLVQFQALCLFYWAGKEK